MPGHQIKSEILFSIKKNHSIIFFIHCRKQVTMKKLLFILFILNGSLSLAQDKKQIEKNASKFLNAYYTFDVKSAMALGTDETKEFMTIVQGMLDQNPIPDTFMNIIRSTKIDIQSDKISYNENKATVPYILTVPQESGLHPMNKMLKMINKDGKWLASYTMEDAMRENQETLEKMQEEDSMEEKSYIIKEETDVLLDEDYDGPSIKMPKETSQSE